MKGKPFLRSDQLGSRWLLVASAGGETQWSLLLRSVHPGAEARVS